MGSTAGMKHDAFIDPDWAANRIPGLKPFVAKMPNGRLFNGETDGSSFPNGGLRETHSAAAFTAWDRGSPPFIHDGTCYIPCAFVSHLGCALDDKSPLLRAQDAVNREGLRLLKNLGGYGDVKQVLSFLGWEQEFFVVSKEAYLARPDLRACGRTLMGTPPTKGQQMNLNYFAVMPSSIKACMDEVQAALLKIGCPLNVYHNEVAPGQHEISPFFTITNISSDLNQIAMQICCEAGARHGLVFLFHEKPFAGINGSGKHNNWSIGTDTGLNFFSPGKTEKSSELFSVGVACLTFALNQHNAVIRNSVACAGNDHRHGAQEAPPAIISLHPGADFEQRIDGIIKGGPLASYYTEGTNVDVKCANLNDVVRGLEDRNRTAPFPFCGNRFEFRAVGSSQNCAFPMALVNTAMADGMRALSERIEGGAQVRDAVAQLYQENRRVIFTGDNYSAEWVLEAERRGLPHLKDAVEAHHHFASAEAKALFTRMGVLTESEVDARAECLFENYAATLEVEAATLVEMIKTGAEAACYADLAIYAQIDRTSKAFLKRASVYTSLTESCEELEAALSKVPADASPETVAVYCRDVLKPVMGAVRVVCDTAEQLCRKDLWPFPSYTDCVFTHHFNAPIKVEKCE